MGKSKWSHSDISQSLVWLFGIPWTIAYQVSLSMGFSRQEYWHGLPFPSPGDLPNQGIESRSSTLQANFTLWTTCNGKFSPLCASFFSDHLESKKSSIPTQSDRFGTEKEDRGNTADHHFHSSNQVLLVGDPEDTCPGDERSPWFGSKRNSLVSKTSSSGRCNFFPTNPCSYIWMAWKNRHFLGTMQFICAARFLVELVYKSGGCLEAGATYESYSHFQFQSNATRSFISLTYSMFVPP